MLVNITKEYNVYPNNYFPKDWEGYYDPEFDWTIQEVWDDGESVWGEVVDGDKNYPDDDEYYDD